jgi:two-component system, cell cycle sensor histidine kinase and response regulator CckA
VRTIQVLLIEPDESDAERIRSSLAASVFATFSVEHVTTLGGALQAVKRGTFDVVLLDVDANHAAITVDPIFAIHQISPQLPVIVISSHDDDTLGLEVVSRRAQDFIAKPTLSPQVLVRTIVHAIQRQRSEDSAKLMQKRLMHADRLAAIGMLAAGVAHEVNNPAAFVMANLSVMREHLTKLLRFDRALRDQAEMERSTVGASALGHLLDRHDVEALLSDSQDIIAESLEGMRRIASTVRDLRTFSKIEREEVEHLSINEVVNAACNIAYNQLRHRAQLVKDLGDVPPIAADRGKLTQVVVNLLMNAAQAITEGSAESHQIRIHTSSDRDRVMLAVTDTGVGIPDDIQDRIFEPFFTTKPRDQGTGLGLSLCAEIVRQHSGWIQVTSTVGKGSRFEIILPPDTGLVPNRPRGQTHEELPVSSVKSWRILIVDDEMFVLRAFRRTLSPPHEVVLAEGGAQAIDILKSDVEFDAIVCDLMMPQVDGVMLHEHIGQHVPRLLDRMIFCSGGAFTERAKDFASSLSNIILDKPVSSEDLRDAIAAICGRREDPTRTIVNGSTQE